MLGQWDALNQRIYLCRDCIAQFADVQLDSDCAKMRERWQVLKQNLTEVALGCVEQVNASHTTQWLVCMDSPNLEKCKRCQRKARYEVSQSQGFNLASISRVVAYRLPVCDRCGKLVDVRNSWNGQYASRCARCEGELTVESLYSMQGIFGTLDDEEIFERVECSHPELFKIGVLPDYWYQLRIRDMENQE